MPRMLTSLETVRVASPCKANWDDMAGDDRMRHCSQCNLQVYDLSSMTRHEAEEFIREREGRACVRFFRRADGTVLTRDCPVGVRSWRRKLIVGISAAAVLFLGTLTWGVAMLLSRTPGNVDRGDDDRSFVERIWDAILSRPAPPRRDFVMGKICVDERNFDIQDAAPREPELIPDIQPK
jgi:hypothetical protein